MTPIQAKISFTSGKIQQVEQQFGGVTIISERGEEVFYPNAWAFPGFVDSHAHIIGLGEKLHGLTLDACKSEEECVDKCLNHTEFREEWLVGRGWNQENWSKKYFPSLETLDSAFPKTPVFLRRTDGHAAWVNSVALKIAGINENSKNPIGGTIERDNSGKPTGILIDNAMELAAKHIPKFSPEAIRAMIQTATAECSRLGLTEIHDMDVLPENLEYFRELAEKGTLPVRVQSFVSGHQDEWLKAGLLPVGGEFLRVIGVKLYADGALGSRGAWLLEPYSDDLQTCGLSLINQEEILEKSKIILESGWYLSIHAIGDAANRSVLRLYETLRKQNIADENTILRIEHSQIIHPDDIYLFAENNVIPAVQPIHCISDAPMAELRLGSRCEYAYPWESLRNSGAILAGGSDFPIESANPILGIDAFCRRIPFNEEKAWFANECISREEAISAYTIWAHQATDVAYRRGELLPNMDADITILDTNLATCADNGIKETTVLATYTAGILRYKAEI